MDPPAQGAGRSDPEGAGEVLAAIRQRTARALWLFASLVGTPAVVVIVYKGGIERPPTPALFVGLALFLVMLVLLSRARRRADRALMTAVVLVLAGIPVSTMLVLGPGFASGAGLLVVAWAAAIFLGERAAYAAAAAVVLVLAVLGVLQSHGGQTGVPGHWLVADWLYVSAATATVGWVGVGVTAVVAVLRGLATATGELRQALARERTERDARIASERALAASARLDAIGRLSAGVVHDTRNTLAVLKAGLSELRHGPAGPEHLEVVGDMENALQAAQETMRQLLSLGGEPAASPREVDASERLEAFARAVSRLLPATISLRVGPRVPGRVRVSPGLLDQALLNLCLNARDAMPGGGDLRLGAVAAEDGGRPVVVVEVEDSGPGLDPEVAARLGEPFATTKGGRAGTGLGLSMVQGFASGAGGRVEVGSTPGRTCFRIVLPRADLDA